MVYALDVAQLMGEKMPQCKDSDYEQWTVPADDRTPRCLLGALFDPPCCGPCLAGALAAHGCTGLLHRGTCSDTYRLFLRQSQWAVAGLLSGALMYYVVADWRIAPTCHTCIMISIHMASTLGSLCFFNG
jgi:hypothetical protein